MSRRGIVFAMLALMLAVTPMAGAQVSGALDCLIEPFVTVAVGSPIDGVLEAVVVDRGDLVAKGDVIARLESSVERATVELARVRYTADSGVKSADARLEFGVRRMVRTEELFKKDLVPVKEMDEAETQKVLAEIGVIEAKEAKLSAEQELKRAEAALAIRTIRSPVDGVVVERILYAGEFTKQGAIVKLAQIDPLRVEVLAPAALLNRVTSGMRAQVTPEAPMKETLAARVKVVDRVVDAASGTFGIRLEMPNKNYKIPAGLKCKVKILD